MLNINKEKFIGVISPSSAAPNRYGYIFNYGVEGTPIVHTPLDTHILTN